MRISDWSSDVCSSDLRLVLVVDDVARRLVEPFPVRGPAGVDERGGRHREQVEQPERFGETDQRGVLDAHGASFSATGGLCAASLSLPRIWREATSASSSETVRWSDRKRTRLTSS